VRQYNSLRKQNNGMLSTLVTLALCVLLSAVLLFSRLLSYSTESRRQSIPLTRSSGITKVVADRIPRAALPIGCPQMLAVTPRSLTAAPGFSAYDKDTVWSGETNVEIFRLTYDNETGETTVMPGYGHQTDSLTWYGDYLWVGNYNKGTITRYDVENATPTPLFNLMDSVFQQKRMLSVSAGGNKVFCGTIPDTGMYGGALAWYDITLDRTYVAAGPNPQDVYYADTTDVTAYVWYNAVTNQVETFDADGDGDYDTYITVDGELRQRFYGVIENQCINCTLYKDGYIIGSTTKANGMGEDADATEGNATIFVYDLTNLRVVATCDLTQAISGLTGPIDLVNTVVEDPYEAGKFWGIVSDTLFSFTFDAQTQTISATEELSFGKENYWAGPAVWGHTSIVFDGEYLYAAFGSMGTYMVNTEDPTENYRLTAHPADQMVQGMDGELYYIDNVSNHIHRLPIAQSVQPLVAASVQDAVDALPAASQITLADQAAVAAARAMYEDLIAGTKAQIDITALLAAEAALEAL